MVIESFKKAVERFKESLQEEETDINRDAAIQRFEFSFELAWKSIQKELRREGITSNSPRSCFKEAYQIGWIEDEQRWLEMIEDRNQTVHTYDEKVAKEVYKRLPNYTDLFDSLLDSLQK